MPTPTNPDRDETHRRRRETGDDEETPDGRAVAAALYGGITADEHEPTQQEDGTTE